jgi:cell division septum initiation protein DivIVA
LAAATAAAVREGCVNETIAALTASEQARAATDPALRAILERIARDEADHAELAWRFVDWALRAGGEPVRAAVASGLRPLRFASSTAPQEADLRASGRLTAAERQAIAESSWNEVILPCAESAWHLDCSRMEAHCGV